VQQDAAPATAETSILTGEQPTSPLVLRLALLMNGRPATLPQLSLQMMSVHNGWLW
jgi:hypothetical protein